MRKKGRKKKTNEKKQRRKLTKNSLEMKKTAEWKWQRKDIVNANKPVITSILKSNSSNLKTKIVILDKILTPCCLKETNLKYKKDKMFK